MIKLTMRVTLLYGTYTRLVHAHAGRTQILKDLLLEIFSELRVEDHFAAEGRCYAHRSGFPPGSIEVRAGGTENDTSIAFYPAGILEKSAREKFKADPANAPLLEVIAWRLNSELRALGMPHIIAKRGGLSTIDLVTSDKGVALGEIRSRFLQNNELLIFIGDRIALNGNDVEAIEVADISIQVGNEWDPQLFPPGSRTLLCSKQAASEGGSADYIRAATSLRRLGMAGILAPDSVVTGNGHASATTVAVENILDCTTTGQPEVQVEVSVLIADARQMAHHLATNANTLSAPDKLQLANDLSRILSQIPDSDPHFEQDPFSQYEMQILKRVVAGGTPVIASDLKDTLAVFDSDRVEWFPGAYDAFVEALRSGPYFLMTGDSSVNVMNRFLLPADIISSEGNELKNLSAWHT